MVAWVVIDRQHHRQAGPFASLLSTPLIPLPHLSPLLPIPYGHSYTTAASQPLCNQSLTHSFHRHGGCTPSPSSPERVRFERNPGAILHSPLQFRPLFSCSCALFCTFLHSRKTQLFCFQAIPHSLQKTPGVWGCCLPRAFRLPPSGRGASRRGGNRLPRELLSECGRSRIRPEKRNGTGRNACPTNTGWFCFRRRADPG